MEKARVVLEQENKTIAFAYVLIDYESPQGRLWRDGMAYLSLRPSVSPNSAFRSKSRSGRAQGDVPQPMAVRLARSQFLSSRSEIISRHRRRARLLRQRQRRFLVSGRARRIGSVEVHGECQRAQEPVVESGAA